MSAHVEERGADELQRAWWLRVPAVLIAPRSVFAAIRDDSNETAHARQEPIAAVVGLAGISLVLASRVGRTLLDESEISGIVVPVWAFIGGSLAGLVVYWVLSGLLYGSARGLGSLGSYRRARHVLGFAAVPLALSLVAVWPARVAVYGSDLFRGGGGDHGTGDLVFSAILLAFAAWSVALLAIGVRTVHGWRWPRALAAVALTALFAVLLELAQLL